ncbi:Sugar (pentulose or hexulose) kinase [Chitinophaga sp. YR573]|uniref:FGGY-family carbohydrate kinase n=1 Tax=Chitinophaga sp. YR573 TaxID=1881040 RepID=UPI0008AE1D65|nr:FGGY-family carbohydrate kinase [Chitinophaga sp. YR573]SEW44087.1 Sugar (pentulose or hexulose) kinase [Chitinophaga sp. YR573]
MNCIAILDIGKTNKKLFLIDEHYRIVWERGESFPETTDEDGDACEDVALLTRWVKESLHELTQLPGFTVKALNFSTYGASLVYLDYQGQVAAPLYNYLKPYPEKVQQQFLDSYGSLSWETASPALGSLNSGLQLYRLKQSSLYGKIQYALHLPQYISYLVTGRALADITSVGCHTMLWDFTTKDYHQWVKKEGLTDKLPPFFSCSETMTIGDYQVGVGLHDSSSALIPYLTSFSAPFVLISTGTWCITLNPFNKQPLTAAELEQDCLCYLTYEGNPVKAARIFAGNEHEQQVRRLAEYYQTPVNYYQQVAFDPAIFALLHPADISRFADRSLNDFASYEIAYHRLMMDIMEQQKHSTELVTTGTPVKRIFVDGGFGRNPVYMHLLAAAFPQMEVYAASVAQATAIGAALAIHQRWNPQPLPGDLVEMRLYTHNKTI